MIVLVIVVDALSRRMIHFIICCLLVRLNITLTTLYTVLMIVCFKFNNCNLNYFMSYQMACEFHTRDQSSHFLILHFIITNPILENTSYCKTPHLL